MTEAKTGTPSPARVQLPALGYSLLLAVLTAFGLHALFFSHHDNAQRRVAFEAFKHPSQPLARLDQLFIDKDDQVIGGSRCSLARACGRTHVRQVTDARSVKRYLLPR